jgi:hypothetical protein
MYWIWLHKNGWMVWFLYLRKRCRIFLLIDSFSSNSIWSHHMVITVPQVIRRSKTAFLLVDGGNNDNPWDYLIRKIVCLTVMIFIREPTGSSISQLAITTSSITAVVRQIPNQPIRFWVCWCDDEWIYTPFCSQSPMNLIGIVRKMRLLLGLGKSTLIWMELIRQFFFNFQWRKFVKQKVRWLIFIWNSRLL